MRSTVRPSRPGVLRGDGNGPGVVPVASLGRSAFAARLVTAAGR